jgi:hypothetical protein
MARPSTLSVRSFSSLVRMLFSRQYKRNKRKEKSCKFAHGTKNQYPRTIHLKFIISMCLRSWQLFFFEGIRSWQLHRHDIVSELKSFDITYVMFIVVKQLPKVQQKYVHSSENNQNIWFTDTF